VHLTAFMGFKAGMTHIVRENIRPTSRLHKKEIVEAVTIVECPKMMVVGVTGYMPTPRGMKKIRTLWAEHLDQSVIRRFYKHYRGKAHFKAFNKYQIPERWQKSRDSILPMLKRKATVIRVLMHPYMNDLTALTQIKAPLIEVQVNGGEVEDKVNWAFEHFEKDVRVHDVFTESEFVDVIGVTQGKGYEGCTTRYGTKRLQRKTHRGLRKVACVGGWHPERIRFTVARAGQFGFFHRTEVNKRIYRVGRSAREVQNNATTENDTTIKNITPMGGFPHYGVVTNDFLMLKGCTVGLRKRPLILRQALFPKHMTGETGSINLKFIDTSSKMGHGRFQTAEEKRKYYGSVKEKRSKKVLKRDIHKIKAEAN